MPSPAADAVIAESRLGFLLTDAPNSTQFRLADTSSAASTNLGAALGRAALCAQSFQRVAGAPAGKRGRRRRLEIVFRVFDDGVGFRYEFPDQPHSSRWTSPTSSPSSRSQARDRLVDPRRRVDSLRNLYNRTPLAKVGQAHTPLTLRRADGLHVAIHEAALVDYSAMWLRRVTGRRPKATLSPSADGPRVRRRRRSRRHGARCRSPTAPAGFNVRPDLNLNEPNTLGDVSWFKPYKYVGIWWRLHLDTETWASGPKHGATTANAKRYIDFAAANGFRGVLIEGWNRLGRRLVCRREQFRFTRAYPDFDLAASRTTRARRRAPGRPPRDLRGHRALRGAARGGARSLRAPGHRQRQDRLRRRCRRHQGARRRTADPLSSGTTGRSCRGTT